MIPGKTPSEKFVPPSFDVAYYGGKPLKNQEKQSEKTGQKRTNKPAGWDESA